MSDPSSSFDHPASDASNPYTLAGDDLLPPVEPPSAGFILQLFVVPALIVLVVVTIWIVFTWLVHRATMRPEDLIAGLQGSSVARWQRASELADMLRNERYADLKDDSVSAAKLAEILDREIDTAIAGRGMDEQDITLRYFLCRALGEFRVDEGSEVLLKAATTDRDPREVMVRRGAIQAIAVRAFQRAELEPSQLLEDPKIESTLLGLAADENELIRSETAYALGQIASPAALDRLETLVEDPYPDARYNAAVALAQHGRAAATTTLAEMLDPEEMTSVEQEADKSAQSFKRALVMTNALTAVEELAKENPDADFSEIIEVLERVTDADTSELEHAKIPVAIVPRARETLRVLQ